MNQKDATRLVAALKEMGVSVREEREGVVCISVEAKHGRADIFYDQAYTLRAILELLGGATPSGGPFLGLPSVLLEVFRNFTGRRGNFFALFTLKFLKAISKELYYTVQLWLFQLTE